MSVQVVQTNRQIFATNILIVDDDLNVLRGLRRTLKSTGWNLLTVATVDDAIAALESTKDISVVLSDQNLPRSSGVELLEYVHKNFPNVVKVMITGGVDLGATISAINRGHVFRYLTKPWDKDELIDALTAAVDLYQTRQERDKYAEEYRRQKESLELLNANLEAQVANRTDEVSRLFSQLEESFEATIDIVLSILKLSSPHVVQHSIRTATRARAVALRLGLDDEDVRVVERASLLHWLGLTQARHDFFGIDLHRLGPDHQAVWEFHPILGSQSLKAVPSLERERQIIAGYLKPGALREDALLAHVVKACSSFEHAVSVRRNMGREFNTLVLSDVLTVFERYHTDIAPEVIDVLFDIAADSLSDNHLAPATEATVADVMHGGDTRVDLFDLPETKDTEPIWKSDETE